MKQVTEKLWICGQPNDADLLAASKMGVCRIVNNRPENEDPMQPSMAAAKARAVELRMEFVQIPVVPGRITEDAVRKLQAAVDSADGAVLAHCKSGTRSLTLWVIGEVLDGRLAMSDIDAIGARMGINLAGAKDWLRQNS